MITQPRTTEPAPVVRVAGWQILVMLMMIVGVGFSFYKAGTGSDYYTEAAASTPAQVAIK
ncbi:hypothetical protein [Amantichitinum ursilacus]|uniref:Uncharacterized protein n=1 Tax=Amantichitinum ursilacus TaxID=857265 RepID=A0A0N0GPK1_9NEIS|nr:hypothetical protein [Amantichitinum ursilacus]KPC53893.1 hypothetical protein WG78_07215 [Amantichitinum ursilacus]